MNSPRLYLSCWLSPGTEAIAARDLWGQARESERALLVEFAAELVALAESGESSGVLVLPAETAAQVVRELARKLGR